MDVSFVPLIEDTARLVTAGSALAIAVALFRLLQLRRDLSGRSRRLCMLFMALMLAVGLLSALAALDLGSNWQSAGRVAIALFAAAAALALWDNFSVLRRLPLPGQAADEQRRLMLELATALQRYEMALRGSKVAVFTQDQELRYTSISKPMFGMPLDKVIGATDAELLGARRTEQIDLLKREALAAGATRKGEIDIEESGEPRWYDLHIEPLRDLAGTTIGLTGAAVDITERKENERHLRLLMRELTHRSKNLLAVIQAMARQTARHAATIDEFVEQFSARLQALARSHDLLVQESWHGASLSEMVRSQLGHHIDRENSQVVLDGPDMLLKPEAAQNIGLALHELSTNAAKYGALSVPGGRVSIVWSRRPEEDGGGVALSWSEQGGPPVTAPSQRGFGSLVIERNLARALDSEVTLDYASAGLTCRIIIPEQHLAIGR
ncbi:MAG TPA: HWE histidine kinase domain-containing protein [Xanthobacteraceae bacterium]|nr:HWE histidine kinase domain-containing protein [Xanthobacteraceae bacterium]